MMVYERRGEERRGEEGDQRRDNEKQKKEEKRADRKDEVAQEAREGESREERANEASSRKLRFKKGRSATFSIDGFSFTIVANEDEREGNSRPLDRFAREYTSSQQDCARLGPHLNQIWSSSPAQPACPSDCSKSQNALWNAITAGIGIRDKGSEHRDVPDDPQTLEEILARELPDGPDVTEKTAIRRWCAFYQPCVSSDQEAPMSLLIGQALSGLCDVTKVLVASSLHHGVIAELCFLWHMILAE
ncbi:hypothetical protein ACEWY4_006215 [Coilia grayii]|uniref:Uncharacterized protein n=1 Tax=Coilia grayii TaxID=363190 RepID=A0ABD1KDU3_9TELE